MQTLTLFVSTPGDVHDELRALGGIVERLQARYWNVVRIELRSTETTPPGTTAAGARPGPADCDVFLSLLGSSPLPRLDRPGDGGELAEAMAAVAGPDLLVYRRAGDAGERKRVAAFLARFSPGPDPRPDRVFSAYATLDDFAELGERHLEAQLRRRLRLGSAVAAPLQGPPFKGRGSFDEDDAPIFFGRKRPIAEALARLMANHAAGHAFLLIHGAAGCGKSSLLRAGLAPRLSAEGGLPEVGAWRGRSLRPVEGGAPPLETLARAIGDALPELAKLPDSRPAGAPAQRTAKRAPAAAPVWDRARLARALGDPGQVVFAIAAIIAALDRLRAAKPAHLFLRVDPLDDLFTAPGLPAAARDAYLRVLAALARSRRIWVVATLRSEFLPRLGEARELFDGLGERGSYLLGPPDAADFREIIRGPALAAGLQFERHPDSGRDLSEQLAADAAATRDALPRLAATLGELYLRRKHPLLTWAAYQELGGLGGEPGRPAEDRSPPRPAGRHGLRRAAVAAIAGAILAAGLLAVAAHQRQQQARRDAEQVRLATAETRRTLAAADFDAAAARVAAGLPDEALPYLLAALDGDPARLDAQALLLETLRATTWHFPELELRHPLPPRRLSFGADRDTLFAAIDSGTLADGLHATLRWDLEKPAIAGLIVPHLGGTARALSVAPGGKRLVLQRARETGHDSFLCDAETMRVIARLPLAPGDGPAAPCLAWSADGLLLAYPAAPPPGGPARSFTWRIIDSSRGQTVRESDPLPPESAAPLAAQLDLQRLRVVAADGSLHEMPMQPAARQLVGPPGGALEFAVFSPDGSQLLARPPAAGRETPPTQLHAIVARPDEGRLVLEQRGEPGGEGWTAPAALAVRLPWVRGAAPQPTAEASRLEIVTGDGGRSAPVRGDSPIECAAYSGSRVAVGAASGQLAIHEILPPPGHGFPAPAGAPAAAEDPAWRRGPDGLERRGGDWRLPAQPGGEPVPLAVPPDWTAARAAAMPADGAFAVLAGAAGMVVCDAGSGAPRSGVEPLDGIRALAFLGDSHRLAALGAREVVVAGVAPDGFRRQASIPVVDGIALHHLAARGWLAIATAAELHLHDDRDFSRVATLPIAPGPDRGDVAWAEDPTRGFLAYRRGDRLDVWSLAARRPLVAGLRLPLAESAMSFVEKNGMLGIDFEGAAFLPLARPGGLDAGQRAALRDLAESVAGTRFANDTRAIRFLSAAERRTRAAAVDRRVLEPLLPGAAALLDRIDPLPPRVAPAESWLPLWERLALGGARHEARILRGAAELGSDHPWFRAYLRGLIGAADRRLYAGQPGEAAPQDAELANPQRQAGEPEARAALKQAAWQVRRTEPPDAAAVAILDARIDATRAAHDREPGPALAIAHAEALALRGRGTEAAAFLRDTLPADAALDLEQAHFLLASGLAAEFPQAVEQALERLDSPWLWAAWLDAAARPDLAARVDRAMQAVDGRGPAAVAALHAALRAHDSAAIARALALARDLPAPVRDYATARALWAQGRSAEVFALWPGALPDDPALVPADDWRGWESALPAADREAFFAELRQQLATLRAAPEAGFDELRALASRLLHPATTTTFGRRRVRDAMIACALVLAHDPAAAKQVDTMLGRARLAGADPLDCLRIEARSAMAAGDYSAAYGRWLEVVDPEVAGAVASDYLEAARCLLHDAQDAPAVELLLRGKGRFAADPVFAHEAAWLLLGAARPEEAGILLEHGFSLPFTPEQRPTALAMLVCAAEQTGRGERAGQAFQQLVAVGPDWGDAAALEALDWPPDLKRSLQAVAARQRGR